MALDPAYDPYDPFAPTPDLIDDPNALSGPGVWAPGGPPPWYSLPDDPAPDPNAQPAAAPVAASAPDDGSATAGLGPLPPGFVAPPPPTALPSTTGPAPIQSIPGAPSQPPPVPQAGALASPPLPDAGLPPWLVQPVLSGQPSEAPPEEWAGHSFGAQPPVAPPPVPQSPGSPSLEGRMPWDSGTDLASGSSYVSPEQGYQAAVAKIQATGLIDPKTGYLRNDINEADLNRYGAEMYARHPEAAIDFNQQLQDLKTTHALARHQEIENENYRRQVQIDEDRKAASVAADKKAALIEADAQRIANTKIDATGNLSTGQKIGGLFAAVMGGLIRGQTGNPADSAIPDLMKIIDNHVAAQKADLDNQRAGITTRRNLLTEEVARHGDDFRAQEAMRLAWLQHASNMLDIEMQDYDRRGTSFKTAGQLKAGVAVAQAQAAEAAKDKARAQALQDREQARKDFETKEKALHDRQSIGVEYGKLNSAAADRALQRQIHQSEYDDKRADAARKEADKRTQDTVWNPVTGGAFLQPEGEALNAKADRLEAIARTAPPEHRDELGRQARDLRAQAGEHAWTLSNPEQNTKIKDTIGRAQSVMDVVQRIKTTLGSDPSSIDRKTWAGLETDFEQAKANYIKALGANASSREFEAVGPMFGGSPDSLVTRGFSRGKMEEALDHLARGVRADTANNMRAHGYRGSFTVEPPKGADFERLSDPTAVEQGQAAEPGAVAKAVFRPLGPPAGSGAVPILPGQVATLNPERYAEESANVGPTGLSQRDTAVVESLARQYSGASDDQRGKILAQLSQYAASPRSSLATGVLGLIRGENPDLYRDVVATLPSEQQSEQQDIEAGRALVTPKLPALPKKGAK